MAFIPLPSYPQSGFPKKEWAAGDVTGSANYQIGGYNFYANACGMSAFETIGSSFGGQSASNNYFAKFYPPTTAIASSTEGQAPVYTYCILKWFYAANSVEVANNTNLSAELFRMEAKGV